MRRRACVSPASQPPLAFCLYPVLLYGTSVPPAGPSSSYLEGSSGVRGDAREWVSPSLRLARSCSRLPTARGERPPMLTSAADFGLPAADFGLPQADMAACRILLSLLVAWCSWVRGTAALVDVVALIRNDQRDFFREQGKLKFLFAFQTQKHQPHSTHNRRLRMLLAAAGCCSVLRAECERLTPLECSMPCTGAAPNPFPSLKYEVQNARRSGQGRRKPGKASQHQHGTTKRGAR